MKLVKLFQGINYLITVNKPPIIVSYWECRKYIGKEGIRDAMTRTRFRNTLQNLYFPNNTEADRKDKGYKVRPLITHFNQSFSKCVSNDVIQSVDEHMVKFKGWSSMKQYIKNKPIKYSFKFYYRCASKTRYLYQFDLCWKQEKARDNLGAYSSTNCMP